MARFWKEKLDPDKHIDYMESGHIGGFEMAAPRDNLIESWVYFVSVASFTFQFQSLDQIEKCLLKFSQKVHPSSLRPNITLEHYWQSWDQRLPYWLFEEPKRQKVVKALQRAIKEFQ